MGPLCREMGHYLCVRSVFCTIPGNHRILGAPSAVAPPPPAAVVVCGAVNPSRTLLGTSQRMHQGWTPAWEKTPWRFLVMGGWKRHSSSETSYPDKLMESRQPPDFGEMQRTDSLGQMKQIGATKELSKGKGEKPWGREQRRLCRMNV